MATVKENIDTVADVTRWCIESSDQCVMCGLCLPHCPSYTTKRNEADSPRGRISLIKAFTTSELTPDKALVGHLESCLQCRCCEAVCPANVPFGRLMDTAKSLLFRSHKRLLVRIPWRLNWLVSSRVLRWFVLLKLRLYQFSGLRWLLQKTGVLTRFKLDLIDAMLPTFSTASLPTSDHTKAAARQVSLFTGCVAEIFDRDSLIASKNLINAAGFAVMVPPRQVCCGALHQHAGDTVRAQQFIDKNAAVFSDAPLQTVVSCASGCGAQLKEHESTLGIRHVDIHTFLQAHSKAFNFNPCEQTIALHTPCTMASCLNGEKAVVDLLEQVPKLKIFPLENSGCCGAAGAYMLTQPHNAQQLLKKTLDSLVQTSIKLLVSSNIGCILHLRQGIARRHMNIEVIHSVDFLNRQLQD